MEVLILSTDGGEEVLGKAQCAPGAALGWFGEPAHREPGRFAELWPAFVAALPWGRPDIEFHVLGHRLPKRLVEGERGIETFGGEVTRRGSVIAEWFIGPVPET